MAICNFNVVTTQADRSSALLTRIGASALAKIYTGSLPADPSVTRSGTLLASGTCSATFGTVTAGVSGGAHAYLTANAISMGNGLATGTPGYLTIETSAGVGVIDLDVTATGGGGSVIMTPNTVTTGAPVAISSCVITE